jgi:protein involved in polysaccharide export with SLBB domain
MNKLLHIIFLMAVAVMTLSSCATKTYQQINYLQDVQKDSSWTMAMNQGIVIQPKDMISIIVSTRNPALSASFNLPIASYQAGSEMTTMNGYERLLGYSVDNEGNINFPQLGAIHVSGLTRWQLSDLIKNQLVEKQLLKDPVITVEFMNFKISVMGEVNSPGTYSIDGDKITILQALSLAKDLTIYGKRDNITVIRELNGERHIFKVDIRNSNLFESPAYYLQQNDIVYVEPNRVKAGESTINENNFRSASFWMSFGSFLVTICNMIILASR